MFKKHIFEPGLQYPGVKPHNLCKINQTHPLAKDIETFLYFPDYAENPYCAVSEKLADSGLGQIVDGTDFFHNTTDLGKGIGMGSANNGLLRAKINAPRVSEQTILTKIRYASNTVDHTLCHIGTTVASNDTILLWADTLTNQLRPAINCGTSVYGGANTLPANEWITWGAYIDASTSSAPVANFYVNGVFESTSGDAGSYATGGSVPAYYLNQVDRNRPSYGDCSYLVRWLRELTAAEIHEFTNDPFAILEPLDEFFWLPEHIAVEADTTGYPGYFINKINVVRPRYV